MTPHNKFYRVSSFTGSPKRLARVLAERLDMGVPSAAKFISGTRDTALTQSEVHYLTGLGLVLEPAA
jgi:hypothetical protein